LKQKTTSKRTIKINTFKEISTEKYGQERSPDVKQHCVSTFKGIKQYAQKKGGGGMAMAETELVQYLIKEWLCHCSGG
jgi:hypothetical protein